MSGIDAIRIAGTVIEALPKGRFRVELVNGHQVIARVLRRDAGRFVGIEVKDELKLRVSPGDMSQGTVETVLKTKQNNESSRVS